MNGEAIGQRHRRAIGECNALDGGVCVKTDDPHLIVRCAVADQQIIPRLGEVDVRSGDPLPHSQNIGSTAIAGDDDRSIALVELEDVATETTANGVVATAAQEGVTGVVPNKSLVSQPAVNDCSGTGAVDRHLIVRERRSNIAPHRGKTLPEGIPSRSRRQAGALGRQVKLAQLRERCCPVGTQTIDDDGLNGAQVSGCHTG